jgi:hypothetical protein
LYDPRDSDDMAVRPVSSEEIEGARNKEKLPELSLEASLRCPVLVPADAGGSKVATACAIAVIGAGSFSGGEYFHRSRVSISS